MHIVTLNVQDSFFDEFMKIINDMPQSEVMIDHEDSNPAISFEEAKRCVSEAVQEYRSGNATLLT